MKVYIVSGASSDHDDWAQWIVCGCASPVIAEAVQRHLNAHSQERYKEMLYELQRKYPKTRGLAVYADPDAIQSLLDPKMCFRREPARYFIDELEINIEGYL